MPKPMSIRVSEVPVHEDLVRIHAEHPDWDEPNVRYLRRGRNGRAAHQAPPAADYDSIDFDYAGVQVSIQAVDDHIEVILRRLPPRLALAA